MSRIEKVFKALDRPALVSFITAGDPDAARSLEIMQALPEAGADIIELGMPFSDPMADGPVIQAAGQRALQAGANMGQTLEMVRRFRENDQDTPVVLMGYANPVYIYEPARFAADAAQASVDGLIIVDLPPEEDQELRAAAEQEGLDLIRLITPETEEARLKILLEGAGGFLYYVSITGVTGTVQANPKDISPHIEAVRAHTDLPIAVGFGIKTPEDAAAMGEIADGVVVGSAIVQTIAECQDATDLPQRVAAQVADLVGALK